MTETFSYSPMPVLPFTNRSGFLIASGILMLLAGVMTGCGALITPVALAVPEQPGVQKLQLHQVLVAFFIYAGLSTITLWLGIGLIKRRRWSRPLAIIVATHWLILGLVTLASSIALYPLTRDMMSNIPNVPPGFMSVMLIVGIAFSSLFMIALPSVILWLLRSEDVRLTVEHFDPVPRWTDRCPIKVLGLSLTLHLAGVLCLFSIAYGVFPIGGVLLRGVSAVGVILVITALLVLAGYWCYKLEDRGWWLGLLTVVVVSGAMIPSALLVPPTELYRAMGTPEEQLPVIAEHTQLLKLSFAAFLVVFAITFAIYLLRVRPLMRAARAG